MSRREKLEQMLERQPDDAFLHYGLAMELVKEGQIEAALQRFDRTLTIDAGYVAAYFHKANTLIGAGRLEEARTTLRTGIDTAGQRQDSHARDEMQGLLDSLAGVS